MCSEPRSALEIKAPEHSVALSTCVGLGALRSVADKSTLTAIRLSSPPSWHSFMLKFLVAMDVLIQA